MRSGLQADPQPLDSLREALLARRKAPAHEAFAFRPERRTRREPEPRGLHPLLAEREAVGHSSDAEERVHRAARQRDLDAGNRAQLTHQKIARLAEALARTAEHRLPPAPREHTPEPPSH